MSKVEEVAGALKAAKLPNGKTGADVLLEAEFVILARAAIEAMRVPTEAMRDRYNDDDVVGYGPDGSDHDKVWEAGIDAALKEQTK